MGNENTKCSHHKAPSKDAVKVTVNDALRKQRELYERKCQELLNAHREDENKRKQETIDKAIEALENEKNIYQKKYEELAQRQQQSSNINHNTGPLININESLQNTRAIYPSLPQNNNYAAQSTSMMQPPFMSEPSTRHVFNYSSTSPSAPPAFNESPTVHCQPALISPAVTNTEARKYRSGPSREGNNQFYCQSCNNKFENQVFKCQNKHNSCRNCRTRQVPCGVCGQPIIDLRNFALEKRLAGLKLEEPNNQMEKCPNSIDGCCLHFKPQDMKTHLKECPFNEIICPLVYTQQFKCSWNGKINQLRYHFKEDHPEQCVGDVDKEMSLNIKDNYYMAFFVTLGAFNFMVHIKVEHANIMMTAQLIGTKISAEKWTYQFHVYNKRTPRRKYQYNAACHSNAYPVQKIFSEEYCAVLNSVYAQSFTNNGQLTYKFYLIKGKNNLEVGNKTPNKSN